MFFSAVGAQILSWGLVFPVACLEHLEKFHQDPHAMSGEGIGSAHSAFSASLACVCGVCVVCMCVVCMCVVCVWCVCVWCVCGVVCVCGVYVCVCAYLQEDFIVHNG